MSPRVWLLTGILCISIYPVLIRSTPVSGITAAFYRMSLAAALLWPYVILANKWEKQTLRLWKQLALCGLLFASDIAAWNLSIQYSSATQASLLTNLSPIWVGIGAFFFLPRKPTLFFWLGALTALLGMVVLMGFDTFAAMRFDRGFFLGVLSGVFYAMYIVVSKGVLNRVSILNFMACMTVVSSLYLWLICLLGNQPLLGFKPAVWGSLVVQAVICQLLGWFSVSYALKRIEAQLVSLALLSQAVVTGLIAWLFINERITTQTVVGGLIILLGIAVTFGRSPAGKGRA